MKNYLLQFIFFLIIGICSGHCICQNSDKELRKSFPAILTGIGFGKDYGGAGAKVEILPFKYGGIFGGGGFNIDQLTYSFGTFIKTPPENFLSYFITGMYGYNGVILIPDYPQHNRTSIGTSFGGGFEMNLKKEFKIQFSVLVPLRSDGFYSHYTEKRANPFYEVRNPVLPISISLGFKGRAF